MATIIPAILPNVSSELLKWRLQRKVSYFLPVGLMGYCPAQIMGSLDFYQQQRSQDTRLALIPAHPTTQSFS